MNITVVLEDKTDILSILHMIDKQGKLIGAVIADQHDPGNQNGLATLSLNACKYRLRYYKSCNLSFIQTDYSEPHGLIVQNNARFDTAFVYLQKYYTITNLYKDKYWKCCSWNKITGKQPIRAFFYKQFYGKYRKIVFNCYALDTESMCAVLFYIANNFIIH